MRTLLQVKKMQGGFTLIELMIVVAIIGILAAIAAPNFARYQSKSRQAEAKIALAGLYAGEKAFYGEYTAYIGDMGAIGYTPEGNKRYYNLGWAASWAGTITGYTGVATSASFASTNTPASWTSCTASLSVLPATNATDPQSFSTVASGQIRDTTNCDVWSIDEAKVLNNVTINL